MYLTAVSLARIWGSFAHNGCFTKPGRIISWLRPIWLACRTIATCSPCRRGLMFLDRSPSPSQLARPSLPQPTPPSSPFRRRFGASMLFSSYRKFLTQRGRDTKNKCRKVFAIFTIANTFLLFTAHPPLFTVHCLLPAGHSADDCQIRREPDGEGAAPARGAPGGDSTAVSLNDNLGNGQP